ncbi:MAG: manganese transporter permease [Rhodobacteraceae bacterium]|nr:MAG: manganese transporter permease [Paracoccaceae bacterium]
MTQSLFSKLWVYQSERYPLAKVAPLLAVFSAASICVSAQMAGRDLPHWSAFLAAFIIVLALFFQMRVCDEYKDLEDDMTYRPERPIPRGLVTLRLIIILGVLSMPITVFATWAWHPPVLWLLGLVWIWLLAMTAEFGSPTWLKARPILYLASHMAIMPMIDLLLTGVEWVPGGGAASHLWLFLTLSFVNGCVLEIGRKLWAPENEIEGVDTYSGLWGHDRAATVWMACIFVSFVLLIAVGFVVGTAFVNMIIGLIGFITCFISARNYKKAPTNAAQKHMDTLAGLWVFLCYATAGFAPYFLKAFQ